MHIHNAPIIHEETISPPQHLPGLLFARVLPGCSAKAFPSDPAEPLAPALRWEKCRHRTSRTSSYPGTGSAGTAPQCSRWQQPYLSATRLAVKTLQWSPGAEERRTAQQLQRWFPVVAKRQVSSERSRLLSLQVSSTGARCQRAWRASVPMLCRVGGDGFPSKPQPKASSRSRASSCFNSLEGKSPSPSGQMKELPRGVWMRPLALQTWAAQPPSSAQHGEVVGAPAGGADIQRH